MFWLSAFDNAAWAYWWLCWQCNDADDGADDDDADGDAYDDAEDDADDGEDDKERMRMVVLSGAGRERMGRLGWEAVTQMRPHLPKSSSLS